VDGKVITGTVTFNYFTNGTCTGTPAVTETLALGAQSSTQGPLSAGSYAFDALYNGDNNYTASPVSGCEPFTVLQATPSAATTQNLIPNDFFTLTGGAAGDGTGTITFYLFAPGQACNANNVANAAYTQMVSEHAAGIDPSGTYNTTNTGAYHATTVGTYTWLVVYSGDNNNQSATSNCVEIFTINNG
jgi:hypothetical protein